MASFTPQEIEEFLQEFFDVVGARQYIGARYVPIFGRAGEDTVEWDDGAPYEPLTVVMHEGVSYVSRRYVPRGIQITDTSYWVETYRFNAQVEQYRQEVLAFQDQIDEIREDFVPFPDSAHYPKYGTAGQVLSTLADGTTRWDDPVTVTSEVAGPLVEEWLEEHPEATTTVQDNSVTDAKLFATGIKSRVLQSSGIYIDTAEELVVYPDVDGFPVNSVVSVGPTYAAQIAHAPYDDRAFTVITLGYMQATGQTVPYGGCMQVAIPLFTNTGIIKFRSNNGSAYTAWSPYTLDMARIANGSITNDKLANGTIEDAKLAGTGVKSRVLESTGIYVGTDADLSAHPDADGFPVNGVVSVAAAYAPRVAHSPYDSIAYTVLTLGYTKATGQTVPYGGCTQVAIPLFTNTDVIKFRSHNGTAYGSWSPFNLDVSRIPLGSITNDMLERYGIKHTAIQMSGTYITSPAQMEDYGYDVNNFPVGKIYAIYAPNVANDIAHMPIKTGYLLFTSLNYVNAGPGGITQFCVSYAGLDATLEHDVVFMRTCLNGTWEDWRIISQDPVFVATPSNFVDVINAACDYNGVKVLLDGGTYDLIDSTHDEAYWMANAVNTRYCGLILKNGVKLVSTTNATLQAIYQGSNSTLMENFSILNVAGDCELEGLRLKGQNIEYMVHDDSVIAGAAATKTFARFEGCEMVHLGTTHSFSIGAPMCIGGGANDSTRVINGCRFTVTNYHTAVSYHTNSSYQGNLTFTNNVITNAQLRIAKMGSNFYFRGIVSGNKMSGGVTIDSDANIVFDEFNNVTGA